MRKESNPDSNPMTELNDLVQEAKDLLYSDDEEDEEAFKEEECIGKSELRNNAPTEEVSGYLIKNFEFPNTA